MPSASSVLISDASEYRAGGLVNFCCGSNANGFYGWPCSNRGSCKSSPALGTPVTL